MSKPVKVAKVPKTKKTVKIQDDESVNEMPQSEPIQIPKPRKSRAKRQPTKEELIKLLTDSCNELTQVVQDLKDEEAKILASGLVLKRVPELIKETMSNLDEDMQEIQEKIDELATCPDEGTLPAE